jgi:molecular chaperone Hsp33
MADTDSIHRFLFEDTGIRGNLVHLDASWRAVLDAHPYPEAVRTHLGQALAAVTLLSAIVKFDGSLILQVQGTGPIRTLVAQATSARTLRAVARWDGEVPSGATLAQCCGAGRLAITIERGGAAPYQGIVPLTGSGVAQALGRYFEASEQVPTRFWLAADASRAAGLLLQRLPGEEWESDTDDDWVRVGLLAGTVKPAELLGLPAEELLHRLFHEETVRLFDSEPVAFRCTCSRSRIEDVLRALGETEVRSLATAAGDVEVTCEFCSRTYRLDAVDTGQLFAAAATRHASPALRH